MQFLILFEDWVFEKLQPSIIEDFIKEKYQSGLPEFETSLYGKTWFIWSMWRITPCADSEDGGKQSRMWEKQKKKWTRQIIPEKREQGE